jgi:hypothetical protein
MCLVGRHFITVVRHDFRSDHDDRVHRPYVLIIAWLLRALGLGWQLDMDGKSALDILKDRFARGEIERAEYEDRRKPLSGS